MPISSVGGQVEAVAHPGPGRLIPAFTLVEVIVALALLALAALLAGRAAVTFLAIIHASGRTTVAAALAVGVLEQVRAGPESQTTSAGRASHFDAIAGSGPTTFSAPYGDYAYEVAVDRVALAPPATHPCWLTSSPPAPCEPDAAHPDTTRWMTVRVAYRGRTLARLTSAVVRGMERRP